MRLWTLHPRYLDVKGLTAAWREALLAQKVLAGFTIGYMNHPQLIRLGSIRSRLWQWAHFWLVLPRKLIGVAITSIKKKFWKRETRDKSRKQMDSFSWSGRT
jgi:hypothetical protein